MKRRRRRIETVRDGNVRVKIYRRTRTVAGNKYATFEVCDYTSGERKLRSFADHQAARKEAERIAQLLAKGDAVAAALSGREAASFGRCLELLRSVGEPPELACARYAEAVGILGNGSLLPTAARFYLERHPDTLPQITLADAAAEMIELRRKAKASEPYLADLRCRSAPFIKAFPAHPASVTTADCQRYLDSLECASGTRNAHRQILWRLFAHCESRGYIPRGTNPVAGTQVLTGKHEDAVKVWTPEEMAKLLAAADHAYLPALAIGAFAGLRTSEILALDWRDVRLADRTIKVVHRAKLAASRPDKGRRHGIALGQQLSYPFRISACGLAMSGESGVVCARRWCNRRLRMLHICYPRLCECADKSSRAHCRGEQFRSCDVFVSRAKT